jgi:hypothetical protein
MEEALDVVLSSLTAPPPASSPTTALDIELVLPAQPPLEIVDEKPPAAHDDMDPDASLSEHNATKTYILMLAREWGSRAI